MANAMAYVKGHLVLRSLEYNAPHILACTCSLLSYSTHSDMAEFLTTLSRCMDVTRHPYNRQILKLSLKWYIKHALSISLTFNVRAECNHSHRERGTDEHTYSSLAFTWLSVYEMG